MTRIHILPEFAKNPILECDINTASLLSTSGLLKTNKIKQRKKEKKALIEMTTPKVAAT